MGGPERGQMNMAIDEAIMMAVSRGDAPPTLRFYGWDPPTVSTGYFQSLEREVDLARCREAGFDVVRRPTGGRAVLHDDEVTYSVAIREADFPGTVVETYKMLSEGLVRGLRTLGIDAAMAQASSGREHASVACFDAPSWYEVTCGGKKIIGSAQTRKYGTILQHGSIPITFLPEKFVGVLAVPSEAARKRLERALSGKAGGLAEFLPERPEFLDVCSALVGGLASALGIAFHETSLDPGELEQAGELLNKKYSLPQWNLRR